MKTVFTYLKVDNYYPFLNTSLTTLVVWNALRCSAKSHKVPDLANETVAPTLRFVF